MDAWVFPERKFKIGYVEDRVVSVDHEYFIFSIDQHHVPAGEKKKLLKWRKISQGNLQQDSSFLKVLNVCFIIQSLFSLNV